MEVCLSRQNRPFPHLPTKKGHLPPSYPLHHTSSRGKSSSTTRLAHLCFCNMPPQPHSEDGISGRKKKRGKKKKKKKKSSSHRPAERFSEPLSLSPPALPLPLRRLSRRFSPRLDLLLPHGTSTHSPEAHIGLPYAAAHLARCPLPLSSKGPHASCLFGQRLLPLNLPLLPI